ncbi:ANTAR domain-containing protein [Streptomyces sp. NPDC001904]|uniref:ANTAR domain-containing protein n=1 Tax=Streptomyces sp. NPDC001904 TaxID=3154531 RepID=UPI003321D8AF
MHSQHPPAGPTSTSTEKASRDEEIESDPSAEDELDLMGSLREQAASLNAAWLARSRVSYAQGLLVGRYRLTHPEEAFALMRQASQRMNVKLHQLAAALADTRAPAPDAASWFPRRTARPAPPLTAIGTPAPNPRNQGEVLSAALRRVLQVTGGAMGNVQLYESGVLRMEQQHGHTQAFRDFFAFVEDGTSCSRAAVSDKQVTVLNMHTTTVFDDETRQVLLDAGSRACHSVPLPGPDCVVRGVISSHHHEPLDPLPQQQLEELERLRHLVGAWLAWHQQTIVLDALEHIHQSARANSA